MNVAIQDGVAAGQSVPHVHCHLIPRYLKDGWGDGIYQVLEENEGLMRGKWWLQVCEAMQVAKDEERKERTMEVMEKEAEWLKGKMKEWLLESGQWKNEYDC